MKKPIVAVFDFDGTLTYADSFLPFLREASNRTTFVIEMLRAIPACLAFFLVGLSRQQLKQRLIRRFLCGKSSDELRRIGDRYCADRLRKLL